jgi:hypothetical protein
MYDPATDRWIAVSQDGAPVERAFHSLVWTGQAVLVWGGVIDVENNFDLNVGGRLFLGQLHGNGPAEVCNGVDDNCDGQVDEGGDALCENDSPCAEATCQGAAGCVSHLADGDHDGVCDANDRCPGTILTPTVVIDSCDSGVGNALSSNGCNFGDQIAACRASARNHGLFVSCVAHRVDNWKDAGLVTAQQGSRIVRCAAN